MTSRWQLLLEQKPRPLIEHLLDEVAKLMAKDLGQWPLTVESLDAATGSQFAPLLEPDAPRPSPAVYREAFRLARWELARELEPIDDYMRNRRYLDAGLAPQDRLALLFLSRWLVEQMLALTETTEGRLKRSVLVDCLLRTERALKPLASSTSGPASA